MENVKISGPDELIAYIVPPSLAPGVEGGFVREITLGAKLLQQLILAQGQNVSRVPVVLQPTGTGAAFSSMVPLYHVKTRKESRSKDKKLETDAPLLRLDGKWEPFFIPHPASATPAASSAAPPDAGQFYAEQQMSVTWPRDGLAPIEIKTKQDVLHISSVRQEALIARVRRNLSHESTIVDLLRHLHQFTATSNPPPIRVIRLGVCSLLLYLPAARGRAERAWLVYGDPDPASFQEPMRGIMHGYGAILGASVAGEALNNPSQDVDEWLKVALEKGVAQCLAHFENGAFEWCFRKDTEGWEPEFEGGVSPSWLDWIKRQKSRGQSLEIPIAEAVSHRRTWFLVHSKLREKVDSFSTEEDSRTSASRNRAIEWLTKAGNPEKDVPIVSMGAMKLVDRREIEDYMALRQAFSTYTQEDPSSKVKPLNIAIFGSPGAGKSFGVEQLASEFSKASPRFSDTPLAFNVSQFLRVQDLSSALHHVRDACLKHKIPIVFFDEFDTALDGRPFGWLKYFLAPMEDGEFMDNGMNFKLARCIFVFAGGVNRSFEELNSRLRNASFCEAKGPDFISRLRGHLNIRGINQPEGELDGGLYMLRRALILRAKLSAIFKAHRPGLDNDALMETSVARAFCCIERFKHGVRSLDSILRMCNIERHSRSWKLGASALPPKPQLDMHVDAAQFLELVYEESAGGGA